MEQKSYFVITNRNNYDIHGIKYIEGVNDAMTQDLKLLYFTEVNYICNFIPAKSYFIYDVELPLDNIETVQNINNDIYGANTITLKNRRELSSIDTWKYIITKGVIISEYIIKVCIKLGFLEVIEFFIDNGNYDNSVDTIKKYIMDHNFRCHYSDGIHVNYEKLVRFAVNEGHFNIVKYVIENKNKHNDNLNFLLYMRVEMEILLLLNI